MVMLIYMVYGGTGYTQSRAGSAGLCRGYGVGGGVVGVWSPAVRHASDGTSAAMPGPAWHGGWSGREGEHGPGQVGPCNGGEQLLGSGGLECQCGLSER
jgi:hypothetical protein